MVEFFGVAVSTYTIIMFVFLVLLLAVVILGDIGGFFDVDGGLDTDVDTGLSPVSLPVIGAGEPAGPLSMVRYEPVGRYAIQFFWSDRHDTGIFAFDFLREICPCDACDAARAVKTPPPSRGVAPRG